MRIEKIIEELSKKVSCLRNQKKKKTNEVLFLKSDFSEFL